MPKFKPKHPLTRIGFERLLDRASQPISGESKPVRVRKGTSVARRADGYSDKRKNQDKIADKEGLPSD